MKCLLLPPRGFLPRNLPPLPLALPCPRPLPRRVEVFDVVLKTEGVGDEDLKIDGAGEFGRVDGFLDC